MTSLVLEKLEQADPEVLPSYPCGSCDGVLLLRWCLAVF